MSPAHKSPLQTFSNPIAQAVAAALPANLLANFSPPVAPQSATKTHTAPQKSPPRKTNPTNPHHPHPAAPSLPLRKPLRPNQLTAARLLLAGHSVTNVARALHVDPYTVSRWKNDPRFQAELQRQLLFQSTHTAPQGATPRHNLHP